MTTSRTATAVAEGSIYYALYMIGRWFLSEWGYSHWDVSYPYWSEYTTCLLFLLLLFHAPTERCTAFGFMVAVVLAPCLDNIAFSLVTLWTIIFLYAELTRE